MDWPASFEMHSRNCVHFYKVQACFSDCIGASQGSSFPCHAILQTHIWPRRPDLEVQDAEQGHMDVIAKIAPPNCQLHSHHHWCVVDFLQAWYNLFLQLVLLLLLHTYVYEHCWVMQSGPNSVIPVSQDLQEISQNKVKIPLYGKFLVRPWRNVLGAGWSFQSKASCLTEGMVCSYSHHVILWVKCAKRLTFLLTNMSDGICEHKQDLWDEQAVWQFLKSQCRKRSVACLESSVLSVGGPCEQQSVACGVSEVF